GMAGLDIVVGVDLNRARHEQGRPLLGSCVGLQVFFSRGQEHGVQTEGIGLWRGAVTALEAPVVPHMGWTQVSAPDDSAMFAGIRDERFYFVHSYAAVDPPPGTKVTTARHGSDFIAAVEDHTTWAAQSHPEKSPAPAPTSWPRATAAPPGPPDSIPASPPPPQPVGCATGPIPSARTHPAPDRAHRLALPETPWHPVQKAHND